MVKVRDANTRVPVSQPSWKKTIPVSFEWPAAAPGDIKEGYQPSNWLPLVPPSPQLRTNGNCEFAINCGAVQSSRSRLVAVERSEEHTSELQSLRHLVC